MELHVEYYSSNFAILDKEGNHTSLLVLYYRKTERKTSGNAKWPPAVQAAPEKNAKAGKKQTWKNSVHS